MQGGVLLVLRCCPELRAAAGTAARGARQEGVLPTSERTGIVGPTPVWVRRPSPRARARARSRRVGPHLLRAATTASPVRVVGGVVTHFLWVSRTTARFRRRLEPGVRAPAPRAGPAPPPPRPLPARRARSRARGARGARSGARRSAEPGWRPRPAPRASVRRPPGAFPAPLALAPGPAGALPPRLPSVPPRPARSARLPQAPPAARVPMDRRTDTCRWVRTRARGGHERADAATRPGSPFVWGAAAPVSALPPPRRPSSDPAEPSFCLFGGGEGGRWKGRESGQSRAAGHRRRRAWGRGRRTPPAAERAPGASAGGRGRLWSASPGPAGRPASPVAAGARRGAGSPAPAPAPAPAPGSFGGGKEGGKEKEKIGALSFQVLRCLWRGRERGGSGLRRSRSLAGKAR